MEGSATNRGFLAPFSFCFDLSSSKASKADMVWHSRVQGNTASTRVDAIGSVVQLKTKRMI